MKTHEDLDVWKISIDLVIKIYSTTLWLCVREFRYPRLRRGLQIYNPAGVKIK
jgi:hypothetical protein